MKMKRYVLLGLVLGVSYFGPANAMALRGLRQKIKQAIEKIHNVKVMKVNTIITPRGEKKALIKLRSDYSAQDIAIDLGIF